jgi:hypothetical protein
MLRAFVGVVHTTLLGAGAELCADAPSLGVTLPA